MKLGFVGAGVVGTALGALFKKNGYSIVGYYSRTLKSAREAAGFTGTDYFEDVADVFAHAEIVFLTTNDDAIGPVARQIAEDGLVNDKHIVIHCSGSLNLSVLAPVKEQGAGILAIHPLQSCASVEQAVAHLPGSVFSIEGEASVRPLGRRLVKDLGGQYFFIDSERKALYHAAAVVASNYLVTLVGLSKRMMVKAGMPEEQVYQALYPLINGTLSNIRKLDIPGALTGPIARGDVSTVADHVKTMRELLPQELPLFVELGCSTVPLAKEKGSLSGDKASRIYKLLSDGRRSGHENITQRV
ncbi:MAG: DUF2520 domain-containing protein [Thermoanaerobacteraceae bacterium]|nr:DUF2520 domain-containing protein [Thermoanaerobacteraceae bacterium]